MDTIRNRPVAQVLGLWVVFVVVRECLGNPTGITLYDIRTRFPGYLFVTAFLILATIFAEKLAERGRAFAHLIGCDEAPTRETGQESWWPLLAGLVVLTWILILIERHQPLFFTQDDNLSQFLPVMLQAGRSVADGIFPTWNPYQFLGSPTTSLGVYALTYPFMYVSYFVSRFLLGNEYLTIEVYSILHLVGAYLAMYWAARCYQVRARIAAAAALCCALSGWALIASRSWYYVSPVFVYMPLIIVGVSKLPQSRSSGWRWIAGMALVIGLFFHAGNVQFWAYGLMFMWIAVFILRWAQVLNWCDVLRAGAATLIGIAVACPVLVVQFLQTKNVERMAPPYQGEVSWSWLTFLIPAPWIHASPPSDWVDPLWKSGGLIVYSGTTFVLLSVVLSGCIVFYRYPRVAFERNVWLFCGVIAVLAMMGHMGILWVIMVHLPLFSKFRLPFKFLAFFNVFAVLSGSIVCERILRQYRHGKWLDGIIAIATTALVVASSMYYMPSWYTYGVRPYPDGARVIQHIDTVKKAEYRIVSITHPRSRMSSFWQGMPLNLPTVYEVPSFLGYDPLVRFRPAFIAIHKELKKDPLKLLQSYGVAYALVSKDIFRPQRGPYRGAWLLESAVSVPNATLRAVIQLPAVFRDDAITIYRIPDPAPLAFSEQNPNTPLPLHLRADGLDVDTATLANGGKVTLNFFWYPEMRGSVDGKRLPIFSDDLRRMTVMVPPGAKYVSIRFVPPWWKGFAVGGVVFVFGLWIGYFAIRRQKSTRATEFARA